MTDETRCECGKYTKGFHCYNCGKPTCYSCLAIVTDGHGLANFCPECNKDKPEGITESKLVE